MVQSTHLPNALTYVLGECGDIFARILSCEHAPYAVAGVSPTAVPNSYPIGCMRS